MTAATESTRGTAGASAPVVSVHGITKRFGGVTALSDVSVSIARGEIHGLVGENGAGKSTLGKIIAGAIMPDEGDLVVAGRPVHYRSPPRRARPDEPHADRAGDLAWCPREA